MSERVDTFDLARLQLRTGEGRRLAVEVAIQPVTFGTETYAAVPSPAPAVLDISKMMNNGWSLRLRFEAALEGPCMRCLQGATPRYAVDAREVDQPGGGDELDSPYMTGEVLDVEAWAHDAFALALPPQVLCRPDCAGLCPECGTDLNADPSHEHEKAPDPRWAALRELKLDR